MSAEPHPSELRRDPTTGDRVVISPGRWDRPRERFRTVHAEDPSSACPFCPGHEAETPPELWRLPIEGGGWRVRVVPNKYPMFASPGHAPRPFADDGLASTPAVGHHEVVIESPDHGFDLSRADNASVSDVLRAYRARYRALRDLGANVIVIFRNHGTDAGASSAHPHSQIIATSIVPAALSRRWDRAQEHFEATGRNLYQEMLGHELADGRRIVLATDRYVAFQPFASAWAYETWIMPRRAQLSFADTDDAGLDILGTVLRSVLGALHSVFGDVPHNYIVQSAPEGNEPRQGFTWHLRIVPRLHIPGGFELGSGLPVNPTSPEDTAAELRAAI